MNPKYDLSRRGHKPIFIVGMNGSGTTMLSDCLNNHPQIYIHKIESRIIPYYYHKLDQFGDLNNESSFSKLLNEFSNNSAFWICNNHQAVEIPFNFREIKDKSLSKVIDITFSYFASRENKAIWGDHSPKYALFIPGIIEMFPDAKIIHIVRDGRDCAQSFRRRFKYNIYRTVYNWKKLVQQARKDGSAAGPDRYLEIKYEDLTESPETHMQHICSFLEVPFDRRVLFSNMPMYLGENEKLKKIVKNSEKWRKAFSKKQIKKLEIIAGVTLGNFGYDVICCYGDKDLSINTLRFIKWIDRINTSISYFKRYKGKSKIKRFLQYVSTSVKQSKNYKY